MGCKLKHMPYLTEWQLMSNAAHPFVRMFPLKTKNKYPGAELLIVPFLILGGTPP